MISTSVKKLVKYALDNELIKKADEIYITNILLGILKVEDFDSEAEIPAEPVCLEKTLGEILDYAVENGIIEDGTVSRDLFDTKLMGVLTPRPSAVIDRFFEEYAKTPEKATDYYYKLSQDSDYIRRYRIVKDMKWKTPTEYGDIDITINLSKPEKTLRLLQQLKTLFRALIQSACSVLRQRVMQETCQSLQDRTTELFPLLSMTPLGASSIPHMFTITSTASFSIRNTLL